MTAVKRKTIFELAEKLSPGLFTVVQRDLDRFSCHSEERVLDQLRWSIDQRCRPSALHSAISTGSSTFLELLILIGVEINTENCWDKNPLILAIKNERHSLVGTLLEHLDISKPDRSGISALQEALIEEKANIVKSLLHLKYKDTIFTEDIDVVKFLLDKDDEVIIARSQFSTLLYFAATIQNDDALKLVLAKSSTSNMNAIGPRGKSLLKVLIDIGNINMVNLLLENGVDLNGKIVKYYRPLNVAQKRKGFHANSEVYSPLSYAIRTRTYWHWQPKGFNRILETLVATLARMLENGEYVSEENIECIFQNDDSRSYHEKCVKEIGRMKEEKIKGFSNICVYDILTRNLEKLAGLAMNKTAIKRLNFKKYEKMFRAYRGEIQRNNERAIWRLAEIERLAETFQYRVKLPTLIFHQILGYIDDIDLKNSEHYFSLLAEVLARRN